MFNERTKHLVFHQYTSELMEPEEKTKINYLSLKSNGTNLELMCFGQFKDQTHFEIPHIQHLQHFILKRKIRQLWAGKRFELISMILHQPPARGVWEDAPAEKNSFSLYTFHKEASGKQRHLLQRELRLQCAFLLQSEVKAQAIGFYNHTQEKASIQLWAALAGRAKGMYCTLCIKHHTLIIRCLSHVHNSYNHRNKVEKMSSEMHKKV